MTVQPDQRRLRNPAALLLRDNVQFVLMVVGAKTLRVGADMGDGQRDSKTIDVGDGGSILIVKLSDVPVDVGDAAAGFFDLRPAGHVGDASPGEGSPKREVGRT
jgi:hypothetical protein